MKKIFYIVIISILLTSCNNNEGNHHMIPHNKSIINTPEKIKIIDELDIKYSKKDIEDIIKFSEKNGIQQIDSIQIGQIMYPYALDSNLVKVFEKENIENNKDFEQRILLFRVNSWINNKSTMHYKIDELWTKKMWRFVLNNDTINIFRSESLNYNEVKEIILMIKNNNYFYVCDKDDTSPSKDIRKIVSIEREEGNYEISYNFVPRNYTLICSKEGNKLTIKKITSLTI